MSKSHLKRLAVPKSWNINKKTTKWVAKPDAGRKNSISLNIIFLEQLKLVTNMRELKNVLKNGTIFVDSKKITSPRFGVGFMDLLKIEKESYRMVFDNKGRLTAKPVKDDKIKLIKIIGKTRLLKKTQLNLADGSNILVDKDDYKTGDSVLIELDSKKIKEHFKLGPGMLAYITSGNHIGQMGTIEKIEKNETYVKSKEGTFKTLKAYIFVIGKEKPSVEL